MQMLSDAIDLISIPFRITGVPEAYLASSLIFSKPTATCNATYPATSCRSFNPFNASSSTPNARNASHAVSRVITSPAGQAITLVSATRSVRAAKYDPYVLSDEQGISYGVEAKTREGTRLFGIEGFRASILRFDGTTG